MKSIRQLATLILSVFSLSLFSGCIIMSPMTNQNSDSTEQSGGTGSGLNGFSITAKNERNIVTPATEMTSPNYDLQASFFDFDSAVSYYTYYLGRVERIPLNSQAEAIEYNGSAGGAASLVVENTNIDTNEISNQLNTAISETLNVGVNYSFESQIDILNTGIKISANTSSSASQAYTTKEVSTFSSSNTQKTTYVFTDNNPHGFYRYMFFADVDCFGVVKKDHHTGNYSTSIHQRITGRYYAIDYCPTSSFENTDPSTLTFNVSPSEIEALAVPSKCVMKNSEGSIVETTAPSFVYEFDNSSVTVDASHEYDVDHFSVVRFAPFLNSDYVLKFQIKLYMKEKSKGYQKINLWDQSGTWLAGNNDYECGGSSLRNDYAWDDVSNGGWYVRGDSITNKELFLRLGAHGTSSDDWVRGDTEIIVTVIKN